jgi:hypothetical protein
VIISQLRDNFLFFNPRENGIIDSDSYTTWDIHFIKNCDILFAYMENSNPSGYGLSFEIGALNKTIILIDERSKNDQ